MLYKEQRSFKCKSLWRNCVYGKKAKAQERKYLFAKERLNVIIGSDWKRKYSNTLYDVPQNSLFIPFVFLSKFNLCIYLLLKLMAERIRQTKKRKQALFISTVVLYVTDTSLFTEFSSMYSM